MGYDAELVERIQAASGSPATTTSTAVVAALRELKVRRLAVAAPYEDDVCQRMRAFLEGNGFEVVRLKNAGLRPEAISAVPSEEVCALARQADAPEAEGLFISCTSFRTLDVLESLERELGKPVVSSNQATMWHVLRTAGIPAKLEGVGRLYRL